MRKKFLRIPEGVLEGMYELKRWTKEVDIENVPPCPCCGEKLSPAMDIVQWGMFDDRYVTFFVCVPCIKAWTIGYSIPTYELVGKRKQREYGLISQSRKSRTK